MKTNTQKVRDRNQKLIAANPTGHVTLIDNKNLLDDLEGTIWFLRDAADRFDDSRFITDHIFANRIREFLKEPDHE